MNDTALLDQVLNAHSEALRPHFKPQMLQRSSTVFNFQFDNELPFHLIVEADAFCFVAGEAENPTITLYVDSHESCWQLLAGDADSMNAFMDGRYRADGNIVLSQLVLYLFRNDDPTSAYEVRD